MSEKRFAGFTVLGGERVLDALVRIDANRQGFVIVVDEEDRVLGVLTDGDVRRAIIAGRTPEESIPEALDNAHTMIPIKESEEDGTVQED